MRKLFTDRTRLVVYLERDEVDRLLAKARESGQTLVEWAREVLRGELADDTDVRGLPDLPVAKRGTGVALRHKADLPGGMRLSEEVSLADRCPHGAERNRCKKWGCYFYDIVAGRGVR